MEANEIMERLYTVHVKNNVVREFGFLEDALSYAHDICQEECMLVIVNAVTKNEFVNTCVEVVRYRYINGSVEENI